MLDSKRSPHMLTSLPCDSRFHDRTLTVSSLPGESPGVWLASLLSRGLGRKDSSFSHLPWGGSTTEYHEESNQEGVPINSTHCTQPTQCNILPNFYKVAFLTVSMK